jgi:hypothetical protein
VSAKSKRQEIEEDRAGPAVSRDRASPDYERPREDVADMPDPVTMPTNKARAGETRGHMRIVLITGIVLTILGYLVGYYVFYA